MAKKIVLVVFLGILALLVFLFKSDIPFEELKNKYTNQQSNFINIQGVNVHYRDEGNRNDSTPLVLIDVSNAYLFQKDIRNSQLVIIPKTGHVPMEENPSAFLAAINQFIF